MSQASPEGIPRVPVLAQRGVRVAQLRDLHLVEHAVAARLVERDQQHARRLHVEAVHGVRDDLVSKMMDSGVLNDAFVFDRFLPRADGSPTLAAKGVLLYFPNRGGVDTLLGSAVQPRVLRGEATPSGHGRRAATGSPAAAKCAFKPGAGEVSSGRWRKGRGKEGG